MIASYGTGQYSGSAASNEAHQYALPRGYQPDGTKRLVVWGHSAGGLATEPFTAANTYYIIEAILTLGLPIICFDGQPPSAGLAQHWGNDTAQSRYTDAIAYAVARFNPKADKVIALGVSMGGMLSLNWARANPSKVYSVGLFYPATSLQAIHDGTGGAAAGAASTEAAYGGSLSNFNAAVAAHDPTQHTAAIAALGVPMQMWYSTNDTMVGTANQTAFATGVGAALQVKSLGNVAHADMSQINTLDLNTWLHL